MSVQITKDDLFKSVEKLAELSGKKSEDLKKAQENFKKAEEDLKKAQICTGSGNEPKKWPGGRKVEEGNEWSDSIQPNGTDYNGSAKARKSIAEKILKGEPCTAEEYAILKGDLDKSNDVEKAQKEEKEEKDDKKGMDYKEDEKKACMDKSMTKSVEASETLQETFEISEFLSEFSKSFSDGIDGVEARNSQSIGEVREAISTMATVQKSFNDALGEGITSLAHGLATLMDNKEAIAEAPARAPKSESVAAAVLSKSQPASNNLEKGQILKAMFDLMVKGQIDKLEVTKYEVRDEISNSTMDLVQKSLG